MPDNEPVARGDRRSDLWIEADKDQKTKVRHTFPVAHPSIQEQSEASEEGVRPDDAEVTDAAVLPEEPSVWEALEEE